MGSRRVTPLVAANLAIVYLGWGSTYLAIRVMVRTVPPLLGAGLRFLVAGAIVLVAVRLHFGRDALRVDRRSLAAAALVGVLLPAGGNGLVTVAERHVPSGLAALLVALVPVWVTIAAALLGERLTLLRVAGVVLGFAGVGVLLVPGGSGHASTAGMLLVVLAALSWAIGSVASPRLPMPRNVWTATGIEMAAGGGAMLLGSLATGEAFSLHLGSLSAGSLEALGYLVVAGSIVTFSAYVWLLRSAPIALVSTYAFVNPLVAVGLGALILSERVTPAVAAATAMIVAAVVLITLGRPQHEEQERAAANAAARRNPPQGRGG